MCWRMGRWERLAEQKDPEIKTKRLQCGCLITWIPNVGRLRMREICKEHLESYDIDPLEFLKRLRQQLVRIQTEKLYH